MLLYFCGLIIAPLAAGLLHDASDDEVVGSRDGELNAVSSSYGSDRFWSTVRASDMKSEDVCAKEYSRVLNELKQTSGTDFIIGAYDGKQWDPAQTILNWYSSTPQRRKILVEAAMPIYRRLQENARNFTNVTLLNAAVGNSGETFTLYCWNTDGVGPLEAAELRSEKDYWGATCVSDKATLLKHLHIDIPWFKEYRQAREQMKKHNLHELAPSEFTDSTPEYVKTYSLKHKRADELNGMLDRRISASRVSARSIQDLLDAYSHDDVGYIQIDIEDKSDSVMLDLVMNSLGKGGLLPKAVLFEKHHFPQKGFKRLEELGYDICMFTYFGKNALAYRP